MTQELSGKARLETAPEPSQAYGKFRSVGRRSYPEGYGCYCADQNAVTFSGGTYPRQKARCGETHRARKGDGTAGSERARQSPSNLLNWAA